MAKKKSTKGQTTIYKTGICVTNDHGYVPLIVNTSRSFRHSRLITGTAYPSGAPEFTPGFSGVRVTQSLVLCVCFIYRCLSYYLTFPLDKNNISTCTTNSINEFTDQIVHTQKNKH
jgi:hypothetical protein